MSKVWFTSDLHFHHKRIVEFTDRGKETFQKDHDEWLIELWNSQVQKDHIIYHLGDFSFSRKYNEVVDIVKRLNGQKFFIKGNHDDRHVLKSLREDQFIVKSFEYLERNIEKQDFILFHFPISSWHKQRFGSIHLHGHCHGNHSESKGKMLDVGLDSAYNIFGKHKFFSLEEVLEIISKKEIYITDSHRE